MEKQTEDKIRSFVNIYEDDTGRYISDWEFDNYDDAYRNRDNFANYKETVQIIRFNENEK